MVYICSNIQEMAQSIRNPWVILGIPRNATVDEIKAQYRKLALSLHPDKYDSTLSKEERREREDRFKEVSVAYQVAMNIATKSKETGCDWNEYEDSEKWKHMWERVESMIRNENFMGILSNVVKGTFKDLTNIAISRMAETNSDVGSEPTASSVDSTCSEEDSEPHVFKLSLSMEEVHTKSSRRVRLFLSEFPDAPFYVNVNFDAFPEMVYTHDHEGKEYRVIIEMRLKPHPVYYWDNLLHAWDLYTTVPITLSEYFIGCVKYLPKLDGNGTFPVEIPPFSDMKRSIVFPDMGLRGKGNLYVVLEIQLPLQEVWKTLDPLIMQVFLDTCKKIDASHDNSS